MNLDTFIFNKGMVDLETGEIIVFQTETRRQALENATTLEEVAQIALCATLEIKAQGHQIVQICGPISTGGRGGLEANLHFFKLATHVAVKNGFVVFDLPFFQDPIIRVTHYGKEENGAYLWEILELFFEPIFRSGALSKAFFLPGWQSSIGARWEREKLTELGIPIEEYPSEWLAQIEQAIAAE